MVVFGFWQLGNKQIFSDFLEPKTHINDPVRTGHDMKLTLD